MALQHPNCEKIILGHQQKYSKEPSNRDGVLPGWLRLPGLRTPRPAHPFSHTPLLRLLRGSALQAPLARGNPITSHRRFQPIRPSYQVLHATWRCVEACQITGIGPKKKGEYRDEVAIEFPRMRSLNTPRGFHVVLLGTCSFECTSHDLGVLSVW